MIIERVVHLNSKQSFFLYIGISCILAGIVFLLDINNLLPNVFLGEYINILLGIIFSFVYIRNKNMITLMAAVFFFSNVSMLFAGRFLMTSSWTARVIFIPGVMLLAAYIYKRKSVILTIGSILTFWGIFLIIKDPAGIAGFHLSIGALMLFTVLAFMLIWIIERQSWPVLPILIFGAMGAYLIADELGTVARNIVLQMGCVILIIIGIIFVIKSLFKKHLDEE
ncbi:MAG: hypothetical protein K0S71_809 [Clostridia bacterium]|jgi:hypothetical protein|nr:hypothetical protein [Clostridia bacterium]